MKRFIIIGLGNFGSSVAETLCRQGNDVIAIDVDEDAVDRTAPLVTLAAVGDGRNREMLERLGAKDCDAGVVSTGDDITASILATLALQDLGVEEIFVKVISRDHARVLAAMGVTEAVFPEREVAVNLGMRLSNASVFNYVSLGGEKGIQEMTVPDNWEGKTLRELQLPLHHNVSVVAVHDVLKSEMRVPPDPDSPLLDTDTLIVAGSSHNLERLARMK